MSDPTSPSQPIGLSSGPPTTVLPEIDAGVRHSLAQALSAPGEARRDAVAAVLAADPRLLDGWAALAASESDVIARYAAARVGYHRGLDALRANGWRGSGYVPWAHPSNHGFLRCLLMLQNAATREMKARGYLPAENPDLVINFQGRVEERVDIESRPAPTMGPTWGYRHRARLSVRHVAKKGTVLVGFHERKSRYVADMQVCPVLPPKVSALLLPLRELIGAMDQRDRLPQIELAIGDDVTALVLRHLEPVSDADRAAEMGVHLDHGDKLKVAAAAPFIYGRLQAVRLLDRIPPLRPVTDAWVTWTLRQRLRSYGHPEFRTDASTYTHAARD